MTYIHLTILIILIIVCITIFFNNYDKNRLDKEITTFPMGESNRGAGLFAMVIAAISAYDLYENDKFSDFSLNAKKDGFYYTKSKGDNWWGYYYKDLILPKKSFTMKSCNKCYNKKDMCVNCLNNIMSSCACYTETKLSRNRCSQLYSKYFTITDDINNSVNSYNFEGYCIGIHYRGTDKKSEAPRAEYDAVFELVDKKIISINGKYTIFVATDEQTFLDAAIEKYGDSIKYQNNTHRSINEEPVHMNMSLDGYDKGAQAMIDMLLLAKSNTLFKCSSNLSEVSTYVNPFMEVIRITKRHENSYFHTQGSKS